MILVGRGLLVCDTKQETLSSFRKEAGVLLRVILNFTMIPWLAFMMIIEGFRKERFKLF